MRAHGHGCTLAWSCLDVLRKSRVSGPCTVPWHMAASSSEGLKISAVTRAFSGRRDRPMQDKSDKARAEDRLAMKLCDLEVQCFSQRLQVMEVSLQRMMMLEVRFMKWFFRHSDASLDFACRLLCFELVFYVPYSLGMIGMRHGKHLRTGVSQFQDIDYYVIWWQ